MKNLNNILIGLAFVVGASIAVPLYMYISNSLFHKGNNAKTVIPLYIQNSEHLTVKVPDSDPFNSKYTLFTYTLSSYKSTLKKMATGSFLEQFFIALGIKNILLLSYSIIRE